MILVGGKLRTFAELRAFGQPAPDVRGAVAAVERLLRSVPAAWRGEVRDDLAQELRILLASGKLRPEGLRAAAHNWVLHYLRDERTRRELLQWSHAGHGAEPAYFRSGPNWEPTEYMPHRDAVPGAWLGCEGARMMHVTAPGTGEESEPAAPSPYRYDEDDLIEAIDALRAAPEPESVEQESTSPDSVYTTLQSSARVGGSSL